MRDTNIDQDQHNEANICWKNLLKILLLIMITITVSTLTLLVVSSFTKQLSSNSAIKLSVIDKIIIVCKAYSSFVIPKYIYSLLLYISYEDSECNYSIEESKHEAEFYILSKNYWYTIKYLNKHEKFYSYLFVISLFLSLFSLLFRSKSGPDYFINIFCTVLCIITFSLVHLISIIL